jgi:hypothetical protein
MPFLVRPLPFIVNPGEVTARSAVQKQLPTKCQIPDALNRKLP